MSGLDRLKKMTDELKTTNKGVYALIETLVDEKSFVECDRFIRSETELGVAVGEGVVSGFAPINGIGVNVFAVNGEVLKGGIGKRGADKIAKCAENAVKSGNPLVAIFDTSGARFAEGIEALEGYGKIINAFSNAYGRVPVISVVKGNNFGLSSYLCAVCDVCIGYEKSVTASSSPLVISAKAGIDLNKVGTAAVHTKSTGLYALTVKADKDLKKAVGDILDILVCDSAEPGDDLNRVAKSLKAGAKAEAVIKDLFDANTFINLRGEFAPATVTGFARLGGQSVGVVATSDVLSADACVKIGELLNTCESFSLPVINIVDCNGTTLDAKEENSSLIREAANVMYLYSQLSVPKIALVTGKAIGAGYTAFCSKSFIDYTLAWPDAQIGALEAVKAAELIYSDEIAKSKKKDDAAKKLAASYAEENQSAAVVSAMGYIDNVIEPSFSRQYVISALQMLSKAGRSSCC